MLQGDLHSCCKNYTTRKNILSTKFIGIILKNNYKSLHVIAYVSRYFCIGCSQWNLLNAIKTVRNVENELMNNMSLMFQFITSNLALHIQAIETVIEGKRGMFCRLSIVRNDQKLIAQ